MDLIMPIALALAVLALILPVIRTANRVIRGPKELVLAKRAADKLRGSKHSTYDRSALIDGTVLAWRRSASPRVRLIGRFLQTWEMQLTQESMAEKHLDVGEEMAELYRAMQRGDLDLISSACGRLVDQVVEPSEAMSLDNAREYLVDSLKKISQCLTEGNREDWRRETRGLKERVKSLPAEIKPSIYLLVGYLESPLQHTEVCIDRDAMAEQTSSLAGLVDSIANRIDRGIYQSPSDLLTILGQYEKSNRPAARPAGQAVA